MSEIRLQPMQVGDIRQLLINDHSGEPCEHCGNPRRVAQCLDGTTSYCCAAGETIARLQVGEVVTVMSPDGQVVGHIRPGERVTYSVDEHGRYIVKKVEFGVR